MANEIPANKILFDDLCVVLEHLFKKKQSKQSKQEQNKILATFINDLKLKLNVSEKKNRTLFPILRLMLPKCERERSAYNMKESKLGALLVKVLSLNKKSPDAQKLLNFKSESNSSQGSDLAAVAFFVLKNRAGQKSNFTIEQVNELLDKIASAEVGNKGPALDEAFSCAIKNLTAEQMKWFLRIILKDLKLGIGTDRILAAFHPDAPEYFKNCENLCKVCEELEDGDTRPPELGVQVFYAVSPMLSDRLDITNVASRLSANKTYQVEEKFDGERFQMHMENGKFQYFSRKGHKYAHTYGETYDSGLLTPYLKDCFSPSITSFILDGEMMGWHQYKQIFGSKGMAFDIKKITEKSSFRPCFCAFDVLYYNGKTLVGPPYKGGVPLSERLKLLDTMFTDVPGVILHSVRRTIIDTSEILDALNTAMSNQEEGIVVKDIQSYYIANSRNAGWYKIKPEYTEGTMTDLDLVIIGADEAENKRQGRAKSFHVACADIVPPANSPHRWVSVGCVATGLSFDEREKVCNLLEKKWISSKNRPPPFNLVFNKAKPDFWIAPENSIALQVRATELIKSNMFGTAYTLRFPRVVRIRDDKPVKDVMTLDEFNRLCEGQGSVTKLSRKRVNEDQIQENGTKITRKRTAKILEVAEQFRPKVEGPVQVISKALQGRKIHVRSEDKDCRKTELIKIIESHGGKHVFNIGSDTWCCIVSPSTVTLPFVRPVLESQQVDVATTTWLRSLPPSDSLCTLTPLDMLVTSKKTRLQLVSEYDTYGDSYKEHTDKEALKKCFAKMDFNEMKIHLTKQEMLNIDKELFEESNPFSFLRPFSIHFVNGNSLNALRARMYGATVCDIDDINLTHVVVSKTGEIEKINEIKKKVNLFIVSEAWLETCFANENILPESSFLL